MTDEPLFPMPLPALTVDDLSPAAARELVAQINRLTEVTWTALAKLYAGRGWLALGYRSWDECCDIEFRSSRIRLPREEREEVVASLAASGLSNRAIAAAVGISEATVRNDRAAAPDVDDPELFDPPAGREGQVQGIDGKWYPVDRVEKARPLQRHGHPATYSDDVLTVLAAYTFPGMVIVDPFAGVGGIHQLRSLVDVVTFGVELEPKWAERGGCLVGDARLVDEHPDLVDVVVDAIMTSPPYGNRMADVYDPDDPYHRDTYTRHLGEQLQPDNAGGLQWGEKYRAVMVAAWAAANRKLAPGGWFVLNIKDHVRGDVVQHVAAWHVNHLVHIHGLHLEAHHMVPSGGLPAGANAAQRVPCEEIYVFRKPEKEYTR